MILLTEAQYKNVRGSAAQDCIERYGKILFADEFGGDEPNTEMEYDIVNNIKDYTGSAFGIQISDVFIEQIKGLQECINTYPEVLKPEGKVYRSMTMSIYDWLKYSNGELVFEMNYKAKSFIQSWSSNLKSVMDLDKGDKVIEYYKYYNKDIHTFISHWGNVTNLLLQRIAVFIEYNTNDKEFMFKSKYLRKISRYPEEYEVFRVGDKEIKVKVSVYSYNKDLIFFKKLLGDLYSLYKGKDVLNYNDIYKNVQQNPSLISKVPSHIIDNGLCVAALYGGGLNLKFVPVHLRTEELCLMAVRNDWRAIRYVPLSLRTLEICLEAMEQNSFDVLKYVPEELKEKVKSELGL